MAAQLHNLHLVVPMTHPDDVDAAVDRIMPLLRAALIDALRELGVLREDAT